MPDAPEPFRFFDWEEDVLITERNHLPHWGQAGTVCFITWRTWDSMPRAVLETWMAERCEWLKRHGIDPVAPNWRDWLSSLDQTEQQNYGRLLFARWETRLDACHGECVLRQPELARIVGNSLRYLDGDRYLLTDFVVMPNHVHVLAAFTSPEGMLAQCDSWKHFTAWQINRALGRRGRFWEVEGFDHLVRGPEAFDRIRNYIADNPKRANLKAGEFLHYSRASLTRNEPHSRSECST